MTLKQRLSSLISVILDEAKTNESFRTNIEHALGIDTPTSVPKARAEGKTKQRKGRRALAVLDPVELARLGEGVLRSEISKLTLDQLRDIVAQYGLDPGKLVMKWKDTTRVMDRIVELALARSTKGDAFRND
jgi:hypothetical protein